MEQTVTKDDRIQVIDVLRGFTLLGIIIVHLTEQYYAGMMPAKFGNFDSRPLVDKIVAWLVEFFISGKFFMIFSFLFGLSFFLQLRRSDGQSTFLVRFAWRLIVLFLIGFIHSLHYRGDILTIYAVLGFGLLICYRLPDKLLLILALLLVFNIPSVVTKAVDLMSPVSTEPLPMFNMNQAELEKYYNTVTAGSYTEILEANLHELKGKIDFQLISGRVYITMGLFLLGLYVGRKRILDDIAFFRKLIKYCLWTILGCIIFLGVVFGGTNAANIELPQMAQWMIGGGVIDIFNAALSAIYVSLIITLFQKEKWRKRLMIFYSVGRMGLTTYLMQTFMGIFIFFGIGLGLLGEIGTLVCLLIAIVIFIGQIFFSNFWLKHFLYGPVEWLWRSLTYFKLQPMRRVRNRQEA